MSMMTENIVTFFESYEDLEKVNNYFIALIYYLIHD